MNYPLPPTSISEFDPQYSLKYFLRNLLIKIELLQDMQILLSGTGAYTRPPIQHNRSCSLRRHLDLHSEHLTNLINSYEEMMRKLNHVNSRLLNDVVACARWELPSSMLDPDVAKDCAMSCASLLLKQYVSIPNLTPTSSTQDIDGHELGRHGRSLRLRRHKGPVYSPQRDPTQSRRGTL